MSAEREPTTPSAAPKPPEAGSRAEGVRMIVTMTLFTLIAAALLGFVYAQTKPRIDAARREEKGQAFGWILPAFDNRPLDTARCVEPAGAPLGESCRKTIYTATRGGTTVGYAVETFTTAGFGPRIDLLVAGTPDGTVTGVYVLAHQETPGLGAKITVGHTAWKDPGSVEGRPFILQFAGRRLGAFDFRVRKDGGEVDAITASTITSRAVSAAIEDALKRIVAGPGGAP
jgi:Na+-translocating ferredoxin:NAD+ oxidoreductase subunit G